MVRGQHGANPSYIHKPTSTYKVHVCLAEKWAYNQNRYQQGNTKDE